MTLRKPRDIELTMVGLKAIGAKSTAIPTLVVNTVNHLAGEEASDFFPNPTRNYKMMQMIALLRIRETV